MHVRSPHRRSRPQDRDACEEAHQVHDELARAGQIIVQHMRWQACPPKPSGWKSAQSVEVPTRIVQSNMQRNYQDQDGKARRGPTNHQFSSECRRHIPDPEEFHEQSEVHLPMYSLNKLTCHKSASGSITSALAWGDLTGMRLDAGQVIEARAKEVQYVKDKGVYSKIPRKKKLRRMGGR